MEANREAYCTEHGDAVQAWRRERYGDLLTPIEPVKIEQPVLVAPTAEPIKLNVRPVEPVAPVAPKKPNVFDRVATTVKDAAQKTGEALAGVGQRIGEKAREVRQEIRDNFPSEEIRNAAMRVKDAAQKTGQKIVEAGHRLEEKARAIRQEIRARAKARYENKTQARLEKRRQKEENAQARTPNLMKTLLRQAPAQDYMAEGASNTQKVQRSPISAAVLRNRMAGRG